MTDIAISVDGSETLHIQTQGGLAGQLVLHAPDEAQWVEGCRVIAQIDGGELPALGSHGPHVWFRREWKEAEGDLVASFAIVYHAPTGKLQTERPANPNLLHAQELLKEVLT